MLPAQHFHNEAASTNADKQATLSEKSALVELTAGIV